MIIFGVIAMKRKKEDENRMGIQGSFPQNRKARGKLQPKEDNSRQEIKGSGSEAYLVTMQEVIPLHPGWCWTRREGSRGVRTVGACDNAGLLATEVLWTLLCELGDCFTDNCTKD